MTSKEHYGSTEQESRAWRKCMPGKPMNTEATKPLAIEDTQQADRPSSINVTKPAEEEIIITALSKGPMVCTEEKPVEYDDLDVIQPGSN